MGVDGLTLDESRDSRPVDASFAWRGLIVSPLRLVGRVLDWWFGALTLMVGLAVLATIPLAQLLSLGYLLEVSGRVGRTGRLRDGFVGIRKAARLGQIALGIALLMTPLWIASSLRFSSQLIDPHSRATIGWNVAVAMIAAGVLFQIVTGCLRGAKLQHFLLPRPWHSLRLAMRTGAYSESRDAVWEFVVGLRLPYYAWLVRGASPALSAGSLCL